MADDESVARGIVPQMCRVVELRTSHAGPMPALRGLWVY
jgi:hypothetical protein